QNFALNEYNGHNSCTLVNMGTVALRLGRKELAFDPQTRTFINDDAANALINQPMRGNWTI
ncbi:MAG: gfo/Idh/MocA family oxidoreductase, partial [Muribaculaceae bacterium]|nr:gfo/Idh/MocA family oxidoreductase [Muribaculaceae bacterium]